MHGSTNNAAGAVTAVLPGVPQAAGSGHRGTRPTRRRWLQGTAALAASAALPSGQLKASPADAASAGKAQSCIFIWLGGGACHIDTWDPKRRGDPATRKPGSAYDPIDTVLPGVQVCEHLRRMAGLLDRCVLVRSVFHNVVDEHAAAAARLHVGRPPTGTTIYPSIGSVISFLKGALSPRVPAYILMGYPAPSRGPGFLGAQYGYIYLTRTDAGPAGLKPPPGMTPQRADRRREMLRFLQQRLLQRRIEQPVQEYVATSQRAADLAGPEFLGAFRLEQEPAPLREAYGGEFGQRCLLARRLVERGARFIEVSFNLNFINGTGWDTHNDGQKNQHVLIAQLDQALAALIQDLQRCRLLEKTLVVVATEFGRPPEFDGGGGRGHYSKAFSCVLAGGGLKSGQVIGVTDELGKKILDRPVSVPDLHATIYAALGIDPAEELFDGDRPVPVTDGGQPIAELFG